MTRLLVYAQPRSFISVLLFEALMQRVVAAGGVQVIGLVDSSTTPPKNALAEDLKLLSATLIKRACGDRRRLFWHRDMMRDVREVARRYGVPVLVPPERDINHPEHIAEVRGRLGAEYAVCFGCLQIMKRALLDCFVAALNYHTGSLPDYRGLGATPWSLYNLERETGYSFHLMERGIDTGAVLAEGRLPVDPGATAMEMEHRKSARAAQALPQAIERLVTGARGRTQRPGGRYYSRADLARIRQLGATEELSSDELLRRLRAFNQLTVSVHGQDYPVTAVQVAPAGALKGARLKISNVRVADVVVTHCRYLPVAVFRALRTVGLVGAAGAGQAQ